MAVKERPVWDIDRLLGTTDARLPIKPFRNLRVELRTGGFVAYAVPTVALAAKTMDGACEQAIPAMIVELKDWITRLEAMQ